MRERQTMGGKKGKKLRQTITPRVPFLKYARKAREVCALEKFGGCIKDSPRR